MSHIVNLIQKTNIKKSIINLMNQSYKQNTKVKIRKDLIIVLVGENSKYIFSAKTGSSLSIEEKNHSSFNSNNTLNSIREEQFLIQNPLDIQESLVSSIPEIKNLNKKVKIKEVQLSISKRKSRLILNKIN